MTSKNRSHIRIGKHSSVAGDFTLELSRLMSSENNIASMVGLINSIDVGCRATDFSDQIGQRPILSGMKRDVGASF